jgi:hypothetical protein
LAFGLLLAGIPARAQADTVTFLPGQYDNTMNTVTAGPVYTNNQTTGVFRDVFWWRDQANNAGPFLPTDNGGAPDYINSGKNLVQCGNSACDNGTGTQTALNFTGPDQADGFMTYLSLYDTTPTDEATTKDTFSAAVPGGLTISADVLFATDHAASAGVVAMYTEGQDGLALLVDNAGNTDTGSLRLIFQDSGNPIPVVLASADPGDIDLGQWYRVTLSILVNGDNVTAVGTIKGHQTGTDPNSPLLATALVTLNFSGTLSNPDFGTLPAPNQTTLTLTNPGEIGVMAMARTAITGAGCVLPAVGGTYIPGNPAASDGCADNVGVSITNFSFPGGTTREVTETPEPGTMVLLGAGLLGVAAIARRKR